MRWLDGITIQWPWTWANSRRWWGTERPDVLWSMGSQRVGHGWATELNDNNQELWQSQNHKITPRQRNGLGRGLLGLQGESQRVRGLWGQGVALGRSQACTQNQVPACSSHLHTHSSQVQLRPCWHLQGRGWLSPASGPTPAGRMWGTACLGQTFGSQPSSPGCSSLVSACPDLPALRPFTAPDAWS